MKEVWKDIKGYEGLYQVSNFGRIKSLDRIECSTGCVKVRRRRERILRVSLTYGYEHVTLAKNSVNTIRRVHRIVADNFIPNPDKKPFINHIDGNKRNNNVNNLEWCTAKENVDHAINVLGFVPVYEHLLACHNDAVKKARIANSRKVRCVETGKVFDNIVAASEIIGTPRGRISACCTGKGYGRNKRKMETAGGYHWEFVK